ncbi:hypothetical protein WICPIJ_005120 [Wickerhamomyces pijperi]|uniref:Uncharacterized protein n=1 Tax=Wickerhamomyces pijperi TaxID=599730 RepID=A0A9P8Q6L6_WICPI|nr:hypothetical protein WICPIJ_005120 [Wickerhamomyces pijperi]
MNETEMMLSSSEQQMRFSKTTTVFESDPKTTCLVINSSPNNLSASKPLTNLTSPPFLIFFKSQECNSTPTSVKTINCSPARSHPTSLTAVAISPEIINSLKETGGGTLARLNGVKPTIGPSMTMFKPMSEPV